MKKVTGLAMILLIALTMVGGVYANMEDDAKTLAQKIASFIKENGKQKVNAEIMNPADKFKRGKMNVTVNDFTGLCLAHSAFPNLVGQNHYTLKDPNGKQFMKEAIDIAKTKGSGWFDLAFTSDETKKIVNFKGFAQRVEGMDVVVCTFVPVHTSK